MAMGHGSEVEGARLRTIVEEVDREISQLKLRSSTQDGARSPRGLVVSWAELLKMLALGTAPQLRECPVCHHLGMRAATLCGYCWTKLLPLASPAGAGDGPRV
jgi:hypothetical protein